MSGEYIGPQSVSLKLDKPSFRNSTSELPKNVLPIIAVDPGGVTGFSLLVLKANALGAEIFIQPLEMILRSKVQWIHGQIDCKDDEDFGAYQICRIINQWPSAAIIFEDFYVRQMGADLSPVRITAVVRQHLWYHGRNLITQPASMAKRINNERLKMMGCYTSDGGLEHARDADRHAIMFIRRCMESKSKMKALGWPHIYGEK